MNEYDSEKIVDLMVANGYERTEKVDEADLVVLNTCSIREKSQEKVFSELGRIRDAKKEAHKDDMLIAVGGRVRGVGLNSAIDGRPTRRIARNAHGGIYSHAVNLIRNEYATTLL